MVQLPSVLDTSSGCLKPLRRVSFAQEGEHDDDCKAFSDNTSNGPVCANSDKCSVAPVHVHCTAGASMSGSASASLRDLSVLRCGFAAEQGMRPRMEDAHVIAEKLSSMPAGSCEPLVSALLAVFDGHSGPHAAEFASQRILHDVTKSKHFPTDLSTTLVEAFVQIDQQYYAAIKGCTGESAGTTALAVLVWGTMLYVANAGDSRAVISRSGKAIDLTRDHKPDAAGERERIYSSGGFVCKDGALNGVLGVARAIGDYHLPNLKQPDAGGPCPLTAEPEVTTHQLQDGDEFMLLGCDGLWDVLTSQRAVEVARLSLQEHNDPQRCAEELVAEALGKHSSDNITVICCCFGEERPKRRIYGNSRFSRSVSRQGLECITAALEGQQLQ